MKRLLALFCIIKFLIHGRFTNKKSTLSKKIQANKHQNGGFGLFFSRIFASKLRISSSTGDLPMAAGIEKIDPSHEERFIQVTRGADPSGLGGPCGIPLESMDCFISFPWVFSSSATLRSWNEMNFCILKCVFSFMLMLVAFFFSQTSSSFHRCRGMCPIFCFEQIFWPSSWVWRVAWTETETSCFRRSPSPETLRI